jgi:hypothetical protein
VALGATTMQQLHVHLGDQVRVSISVIPGFTKAMTIVGTVVVPALSEAQYLGKGAVLPALASTSLVPKRFLAAVPQPGEAFVTFAPGQMTPAGVARLKAQVGPEYAVLLAQPPSDVVSFGDQHDLPLALSSLLGGEALATLTLTLAATTSRRRRDLAVLKSIGCTPRQVRGIVAWQASVTAALGVVVGVPAGIALGRWLWDLVAQQLGIVPDAIVPGASVIFIVAGALVVANLVASLPGEVAARVPPASVLRQV